MTNTFSITADVNTNSTENSLGLEVWIDDKLLQNIESVVGPTIISIDVEDVDGVNHELRFVLKNKTQDHTVVDESGNILRDSVVEIKNLKFDDIELGHMFHEQAVYKHNFNGNGPDTEETFYGTMGCNGSVVLKFSTPIYLWLLENM
jgi:nicotinate-nucleotide pyrophosphorylase